MNTLARLISDIYKKNEGDLVADEGFERSFLSAVNACLLVYSLIFGLHCLFYELMVLSVANLVFSFVFMTYFIFTYILQSSLVSKIIDHVSIFLFFIVIYLNGNILGFGGTPLVLYPFVALVLHGRRLGIIVSSVQIVCFFLVTVLLHYGAFPTDTYYTYQEAIVVIATQIISIFVYFVMIRWMSALIYDRNAEVYQLNKDLKTKSDVIDMLTKQLHSPLSDISGITKQLMHDQTNAKQAEQIANIKASVDNMFNKIESANNASKYNIRPIENEDVVFNAYSLISNILKLYPSKMKEKQHAVIISPELPKEMQGNSAITRQILLDIFDSLNRKIVLSETSVRIIVSLHDALSMGISINFCVHVEAKYSIDTRNLSTVESQLIQSFDLGMAKRMAQSTGGEFKISYDKDFIDINFTQSYKNADHKIVVDPDLVQTKKTFFIDQGPMNLCDATVLIVDDNEMDQKIMVMYVRDKVKKVLTANNGHEALGIYENNKVDVVLMDLQMPEMDGYTTAIKMREMESGLGKRVPIIAVTAYAFPESETRCLESGMDGYVRKPFKAEAILSIVDKKLRSL